MAETLPIEEFVRRIHGKPGQIVLAVTGGGSQAISNLLTVPGGSRTVLEAIVPYSAASLSGFLKATPEHFCSARTARLMAMAAFERARSLQKIAELTLTKQASISPEPALVSAGDELPPAQPVGIGCTASLASDRPKHGPHRIHVALQTAEATATHSLELVKDRRSRMEEESVAAQLVLNAVAEAFGIPDRLTLPLVEKENVESTRTTAPTQWRDLLLGKISLVSGSSHQLGPGESLGVKSGKGRAIFPGAFNPLHAGHLQMAEVAAARLRQPVEFELSIENVDKPPLDYTEIEQRVNQFERQKLPLWLTRAPTFEKKSQLFPGATFVVGADTMLRIGQPRYYGNDSAAAEAAFQKIVERGCRFLVFGRVVNQKFQSCADLPLPETLRKLCDEVPSEHFRHDVSSTELRKQENDD